MAHGVVQYFENDFFVFAKYFFEQLKQQESKR